MTDRLGALFRLKRSNTELGHNVFWVIVAMSVARLFKGVGEILGRHVRVQIIKPTERHTLKRMPQPWGVERSVAWLEKSGRLWKNCERKLNTRL